MYQLGAMRCVWQQPDSKYLRSAASANPYFSNYIVTWGPVTQRLACVLDVTVQTKCYPTSLKKWRPKKCGCISVKAQKYFSGEKVPAWNISFVNADKLGKKQTSRVLSSSQNATQAQVNAPWRTSSTRHLCMIPRKKLKYSGPLRKTWYRTAHPSILLAHTTHLNELPTPQLRVWL